MAAAVRRDSPPPARRAAMLEAEGEPVVRPRRLATDPLALAWHREHVFGLTAGS
jgi:hypothetical protein